MQPIYGESKTYQNQFLVSVPQLDDPNFHQSVVLICKHDEEGAVGIVINRLTDHKMSDIFEQLGLEISSSPRASVSDDKIFVELAGIAGMDEKPEPCTKRVPSVTTSARRRGSRAFSTKFRGKG